MRIRLSICLGSLATTFSALAQPFSGNVVGLETPVATSAVAPAKPSPPDMVRAATRFLRLLTPEQRRQATYPFADAERFNWHFVPRDRKGLPLKQMTPEQRTAAMALLQTALSDSGYSRVAQIIDLENVLRVVENRPPNDTYRDPENYYVTIFGVATPDDASPRKPASARAAPWGWRFEGHHVSLQFSSVENRVLAMTPMFLGSNPGVVRANVPQRGRQVLKTETELAFALLTTLNEAQRRQAVLAPKAYPDILTGNQRRASLDKMDGLPLAAMTTAQRRLFLDLLQTYLRRYHVTLANQQLDKLERAGLDSLRFAWAGDLTPELGAGGGHYYRIHGPTLLIEYDNTQNNANHVHTVVRDLTNDFGDDLLRAHYEQRHAQPKAGPKKQD